MLYYNLTLSVTQISATIVNVDAIYVWIQFSPCKIVHVCHFPVFHIVCHD